MFYFLFFRVVFSSECCEISRCSRFSVFVKNMFYYLSRSSLTELLFQTFLSVFALTATVFLSRWLFYFQTNRPWVCLCGLNTQSFTFSPEQVHFSPAVHHLTSTSEEDWASRPPSPAGSSCCSRVKTDSDWKVSTLSIFRPQTASAHAGGHASVQSAETHA